VSAASFGGQAGVSVWQRWQSRSECLRRGGWWSEPSRRSAERWEVRSGSYREGGTVSAVGRKTREGERRG
jgi:hypothetical protein